MSKTKVKKDGRGILYVAIGDEAYRCAVLSLFTVRRHMPDVQAAIVTDSHLESSFDITDVVDEAVYDPGMKIETIAASPFERTVFLDADTFLCTPIYELFDILDTHDVAAAHQANRRNWPTVRPVPRVYPEVNSGVLAYRKSKIVTALFSDWLDSYHKALGSRKFLADQGALRESLYYSSARLCVLPPEFNLHVTERSPLGADAVRVLHGGPPDAEFYEAIEPIVNSEGVPRLYIPASKGSNVRCS